MDFLSHLRTAELHVGDFLLPWGMVVSAFGYLAAWGVVIVMERLGFTRRVWNLPLFFVALAVLFGCVIGLILAP